MFAEVRTGRFPEFRFLLPVPFLLLPMSFFTSIGETATVFLSVMSAVGGSAKENRVVINHLAHFSWPMFSKQRNGKIRFQRNLPHILVSLRVWSIHVSNVGVRSAILFYSSCLFLAQTLPDDRSPISRFNKELSRSRVTSFAAPMIKIENKKKKKRNKYVY